jgi:flagellar biosynthesis anti-sigma factor FlgM
MTSPISSFSSSQDLSGPSGAENVLPTATPSAGAAAIPSSGSAPSGEAVTLTPDAQTSTALLEAARDATGIDQQAVQSLKAGIISGTYQVPPESLAASIVTALSETRS